MCWSVLYITSLEISFQSLFENVVLGSLKSLFQLDRQVDISLYLTEATVLCHSRELTDLKPTLCRLQSH
jgi:hypothetical protein